MSTFSQLFIICSSLFFSVNGRIYMDGNGTIITGDNLLVICDASQTCETDFTKNVYASSQPYLDRQYTQLLFPEMYDQFDSDKECGTGSKFVTFGSCAQIHSPYTPEHEEGDLKVTYVEEQYTLKWANIRDSETPVYDAILDNSAAYWVDDLSYYYTIWSEIGADIVFLKWEIKDTNDNVQDAIKSKTYYSIITHNGDVSRGSTLTQHELISDKFSGLTDEIKGKMILSEQRIFFDGDTDYRVLANTCQSYAIGVRRAVTNIQENIEWYLDIFEATIPEPDVQVIEDTFTDYNGNTVHYAHLHLNDKSSGTTISLFKRDSELGTYGEFKISDFENGMNNAHSEFMLNPYCGIDRWFDNHMAITLNDDYASSLVLRKLMESGNKYTVYRECGTLGEGGDCVFDFIPISVYMSEPNGHSIQMVFNPTGYVSFLTTPMQWDPDWCDRTCKAKQLPYSYGDTIATFTNPDTASDSGSDSDSDTEAEDSDSDTEDQSQLNLGLNGDHTNDNSQKNSVINYIVLSGALLLISGLLIGALLVHKNKKSKADYQELPQ